MFADLTRAVAQLPDPASRRVLALGVGGAILMLLATAAAIGWVLIPLVIVGVSWLDWMADLLGGLLVVALLIYLFPGVVAILVSTMIDPVAEATERRWYPSAPPARHSPLAEQLLAGLRIAAIALPLNLLVLPLWLLFPGISLPLFLALNGYILGREYFEQVALRRMPPADARALRKAHAGQVWLAGVLVAFFAILPILNLTTPIVATAFMVHRLERLRAPALRPGSRQVTSAS